MCLSIATAMERFSRESERARDRKPARPEFIPGAAGYLVARVSLDVRAALSVESSQT